MSERAIRLGMEVLDLRAENERLNGQLLTISHAVGEALVGTGYGNVSRSPVDVLSWFATENERLRAEKQAAVIKGQADAIGWAADVQEKAAAQREAAVRELVRAAGSVLILADGHIEPHRTERLRVALFALRSAWPGIGE